MCSSTYLVALLLMLFVQGLAVVAKIKLSSTQYVVPEGAVCVTAIKEDGPANGSFPISFSYSTKLSGTSGVNERISTAFFQNAADTAQLCVPNSDDRTPCEANITGRVTLISIENLIEIGEPSSAHVIVQDDDFVNASFEESNYTLSEGGENNKEIIVTYTPDTEPIKLNITQVNTNIGQSSMILNTTRNRVTLEIQDNDIALEVGKQIILQLSVYSHMTCNNVNLSPHKSTTILILDNDNVTLKLTNTSGAVAEGESYQQCIALSHRIARRLTVLLHILSDTADLSDTEMMRDVISVNFEPYSATSHCVRIGILKDRVIEGEESFRIRLSVSTILPASIQGNLVIGASLSQITIQDTSLCTDVTLYQSNSSIIYVDKETTLCFSCPTCSSQLSWNITSYHGYTWRGMTGNTILSDSKLPFTGQVFSNGTLQVLNSSSAFSTLSAGILSYSDESNTLVYNIYLKEEVAIEEASIQCSVKDSSATLTCHYKGSPRPNITWMADSQPIPEDSPHQIHSEGENSYRHILFVNSTLTTTKYTCRVSNSFESVNSTVNTHPCHNNGTSSTDRKSVV